MIGENRINFQGNLGTTSSHDVSQLVTDNTTPFFGIIRGDKESVCVYYNPSEKENRQGQTKKQ